jgi:hypothetical protein
MYLSNSMINITNNKEKVMEMEIYKTTSDGWSDIELTREIIEELDNLSSLVYELKNCVRKSTLQEIRDEVREASEKLISIVDQIQDDDIVQEVEE